MVRRKTNRTPATATPGVVGPTPLGGSSRRGGRGADQQGLSAGFSNDQTNAEGTKKLKPVSFFGSSMPRTSVIDKAVPEAGGEAVAVVEEPTDPSLQPVTIADIDQGERHCRWFGLICCVVWRCWCCRAWVACDLYIA